MTRVAQSFYNNWITYQLDTFTFWQQFETLITQWLADNPAIAQTFNKSIVINNPIAQEHN